MRDDLLLYDSNDLTTHAMCVGMTGSGKTGLCISLLEEAAIDGILALVIDPEGDLANLMLTFPNMEPSDLLPWLEADAAARAGMPLDELATHETTKWRDDLQQWGMSIERIADLKKAADVSVYTPGSDAGLPLSVLASFSAPNPEMLDDADLMHDRIGTTASSLLALLGISADPIRSREHILLSTILDNQWRQDRNLDLGDLIRLVQQPPVQRIGVLDIDSFYPEKDRFALAMLGRKKLSSTTITRAGTTARSASRTSKQRQDVQRAEQKLSTYQEQWKKLDETFQAELEKIKKRCDPQHIEFETLTLKPRKANVDIRLPVLAWKQS